MDFDHLTQLPRDVQKQMIIDHVSGKDLLKLCQTNVYFSKLCSDDRIWFKKFGELATELNIQPAHIEQFYIFGGTWLESTRALMGITNPKQILSIFITFPNGSASLVISYRTTNLDEIITCLSRDYNQRVEPVYSLLRKYMRLILPLQTNTLRLQQIINGTVPMDNKSFWRYLSERSERGISFHLNFLFDLNNTDRILTLFDTHSIAKHILFSITATNLTRLYKLLSFLLNTTESIIQPSLTWLPQTQTTYKSLLNKPVHKNLVENLGKLKDNFGIGVNNFSPMKISNMLDVLAQRNMYSVHSGTIKSCTIYTSLVPWTIPLPKRPPQTFQSPLKPLPSSIPLPPIPLPLPPPLRDLKSHPPPQEWIDRLNR